MSRDASIRLYRGLLCLYPLEFREHFSQEVCLLLADNLRAQSSGLGRLVVWLSAAAAVFTDAPREHYHMIRQDVIYALRSMRRERVTTLIAVFVLALGIGSTATIFNLVNGLLLHPLPFPEQNRLLYVEEFSGNSGIVDGSVAFLNYLDLAAANRTLESFALYRSLMVTLRQPDAGAQRIKCGYGTAPLFHVLGVKPLLGRTFGQDDDLPKSAATVILSEDLWRRQYGADPASAEWRHLGRLAGFTNRKPARLQPNGLPPWVRVVVWRRDGALSEVGSAAATAVPDRVSHGPAAADMGGGTRPSTLYWQCLDALGLLRRFPVPDWSIADYRVARLLLQGGCGAEQVATILRQSSPGFPRRHAHPDDYLRRTVQAAIASLACRPAFSRAPMVLQRS